MCSLQFSISTRFKNARTNTTNARKRKRQKGTERQAVVNSLLKQVDSGQLHAKRTFLALLKCHWCWRYYAELPDKLSVTSLLNESRICAVDSFNARRIGYTYIDLGSFETDLHLTAIFRCRKGLVTNRGGRVTFLFSWLKSVTQLKIEDYFIFWSISIEKLFFSTLSNGLSRQVSVLTGQTYPRRQVGK